MWEDPSKFKMSTKIELASRNEITKNESKIFMFLSACFFAFLEKHRIFKLIIFFSSSLQ